MAVVLKTYPFPTGIDNTQRRIKVSGPAAVTGTYAAGGIATTWTFTDSVTGEAVLLNTNASAPIMAYFTSVSGSGFDYAWNKATNKLQIFTTGTATQSPKAELSAGTVPTGVSSDVIEFDADFARAIE
jgi:hypothetical protein